MKKEKKERNKREWVKNAAIVFLAVMLVLTFFSNTIMNYSLPQVATQYVQPDSITAKIRGSGTVVAADPYEVKGTESRKITSVKVTSGDQVEKGDTLFELEDKESDELIAAREHVVELELSFNQALIADGISVELLNRIKNGNTTGITEMQNQLTTAQGKIDTLKTEISGYQTTVANLEAQLALLGFVDTSAEATAVTNAKTQVTNANAAVTTAEANSGNAQTELNNAKNKYDSWKLAKSTYDSAVEASTKAYTLVTLFINAYGATPNSTDSLIITSDYQIVTESSDTSTDTTTTENGVRYYYGDVKASYDLAKANEETALTELNKLGGASAGEGLLNSYTGAQSNYDSATSAYSTAVTNQAAANNVLASAQETLANKADTSESEKSLNKQLATTNASLATAQMNLTAATEAYSALQKDFTNEMVIANQYATLEAARAKVAELEENATGATIVAPISGRISNVSIVAGESMAPDMTLVTIQPAGKEMTVSISVTNEQARKVSVGAVGEVANAWYYNDIKLVLTQIKTDKDNPANNKLLVFSVQGDVRDGQSLDISVGDKSTSYDYVVPNSAVREDKDGKYILIVESKSSPLGNRYIATKVPVEVLASDDKQTAVKGDIENYSYVITTSSKPIEPGDQVRFYE